MSKKNQLELLHPELSHRILLLLIEANRQGLYVEIHKGYRSFEEQNSLYVKRNKDGKRVTRARGGLSWHNYGLAADIVFKDKQNNWTWEDSLPWKKLGEIGKKCGLEWGGDWGWDMPHFQMTYGISIRSALRTLQQSGLGGVWLEIDKLLEGIKNGNNKINN